jgi:nicotinamidase-related amidase
MLTRFEEIVNLQAVRAVQPQPLNRIFQMASKERIRASKDDTQKVLLLLIDMQNDFMEHGELAVPGSYRDVERTTAFIYRHLEEITEIMVSLDTHQPHQIFHPAWWVDAAGNHPQPMTIITAEEVVQGKWKALKYPEQSLKYVRQLQERGKKQLCIWPYHCLAGTFGAALESQLSNMVYFHSIARQSDPIRIVKGLHPVSEMYGIIKPEVSEGNEMNVELLARLKQYDRIFVAGEAKSHCVLETLLQIAEHEPSILAKTVVLEDCMSVIPGFEEETETAFAQLAQRYGMQRADTLTV